ncbi:MAG: type II toxin-antitoxin system RelE/ParE family toxin [Bdellovibrionaceae bacterium]|nr:type II toxin-antitoxin system RelE/ParE family toxin [Pseudobdellovibrionaceae bacterium]NUM59845.1 type II toxin-antitoxin system RelE/ParE family toxin [Pseudobdellovibrionaceae bacterium]
MSKPFKALFYKDSNTEKEPFRDWLDGLRDNAVQARIAVRIARAEDGNFGDHKSVGGGVYELRISFGPGYRVYYAIEGQKIILLLVGGDKSTQSKDIEKAQKFWVSHKKEK